MRFNSDMAVQRRVHRFANERWRPTLDSLAVEEPLEIRLGGRRFTLTMRTPGHDDELVAGFLFAEGFIESRDQISEIRPVRDVRGAIEPNSVDVILNVQVSDLRERLQRNFTISSSCGVCGKTSIDALRRRIAKNRVKLRVSTDLLIDLGPRMRSAQKVFTATGGLHAAALFLPDGTLRALREDVGRHNAVDKVVGWALMQGETPLSGTMLVVSGRLSFEIVQKAAAAGVPIVAAISAPSSLAVELAKTLGITLVGFIRERGFNVYCHQERVVAI